ncbi:hypothetical protein F4813DRAFT_399019 [Daldinia decipiens]|uniref:uncharacterized protein n=1 Tax=Daldinia decipiens TaxID=326647 RepID=UPI0020C24867|nr:uncharacterized protein F4813DRAFT_399019 [Daldinia decipiens]KAI1654266.1 hypothetical protein F4813DRAFT_399019 [Daldinia decipiens]
MDKQGLRTRALAPYDQDYPTNVYDTRPYLQRTSQRNNDVYRSDLSDASVFRTNLYRGDDLYSNTYPIAGRFAELYPDGGISRVWSDATGCEDETSGRLNTQFYSRQQADYPIRLFAPSQSSSPSSSFSTEGILIPSTLARRKTVWDDIRGRNTATFPGCEPFVIRLPAKDFHWDRCYGTQKELTQAVQKRFSLIQPVIRLSPEAPKGKEIVLGMRHAGDWDEPEAHLLLNDLFDTMVSYSLTLLSDNCTLSFVEYQRWRCTKLLRDGSRRNRY